MTQKYFVGIDLGGTKISGIVVNINGETMAKHTVSTKAEDGEEAILQRIITVIERVIQESAVGTDKIIAIGIGSPGSLNTKTGTIIATANLPFRKFNIVRPVMERFQIPIYLDNDANVATIGEYLFGAGKGSQHMIFITVSTGIGGGAVLNGKIYRGNNCNALEIGHTTLETDGPRCNCGNYGCAEVLASGTAIAKAARNAIIAGQSTTLTSYEKPTAYDVFKEADSGDRVARSILNKALTYLGICAANVITTFDPEKLIIGGGVAQGGKMVFDRINEVVKERCPAGMWENTQISPATLGTDAGVIGAAALAIMESR